MFSNFVFDSKLSKLKITKEMVIEFEWSKIRKWSDTLPSGRVRIALSSTFVKADGPRSIGVGLGSLFENTRHVCFSFYP